MKRKTIIINIAVLALGLVLGAVIFRGGGDRHDDKAGAPAGGHAAHATATYSCSMHPQIQLPEAGQCPICFMDLIPVEEGLDVPWIARVSFDLADQCGDCGHLSPPCDTDITQSVRQTQRARWITGTCAKN